MSVNIFLRCEHVKKLHRKQLVMMGPAKSIYRIGKWEIRCVVTLRKSLRFQIRAINFVYLFIIMSVEWCGVYV